MPKFELHRCRFLSKVITSYIISQCNIPFDRVYKKGWCLAVSLPSTIRSDRCHNLFHFQFSAPCYAVTAATLVLLLTWERVKVLLKKRLILSWLPKSCAVCLPRKEKKWKFKRIGEQTDTFKAAKRLTSAEHNWKCGVQGHKEKHF